MDAHKNSADHPKSFGFNCVDGWAVTYPNKSIISHQWTIRDFFQVYNSHAGDITSGNFEGQFEGKGGRGYQWKLRINKQISANSDREFISVFLYQIEEPLGPKAIPIQARFQISLLDATGNIFRRAGGEDSDIRVFEQNRGFGFKNFCLVEHLHNSALMLLPAGELLLDCKVWIQEPGIVREGRGGNVNRNNGQPSRSERLVNDLEKLLRGGFGSDFTILVADSQTKFPVHKFVLAGRSPVFKAMLNTPVKESEDNATLVVTHFDAEVVAAMVEYMYTGAINQKLLESRALDMLKISYHYFLDELRGECEIAVAKTLDVDNAMEILVLSDTFNCEELKKVALRFVNAHKDEVKKTATFQTVCQEYPAIVVDLYVAESDPN